jgi:hypothetical protein
VLRGAGASEVLDAIADASAPEEHSRTALARDETTSRQMPQLRTMTVQAIRQRLPGQAPGRLRSASSACRARWMTHGPNAVARAR